MKKIKLDKVLLSLPMFFLFSHVNAAEQGVLQGNNTYIIPKHQFTNSQVFNKADNSFILLNGKNYYGVKKDGDINGITLIYNNPKTPGLDPSDLTYKQEILIPNFKSDIISPDGNNIEEGSEFSRVQQASYIPFLVSAFSNTGNVNSNKLIIENGELSSVYFLKPSDIETHLPTTTGNEDKFDYLIAGGFTKSGRVLNNSVEIKEQGYINMGVENTYSLPLNGAPYVIGGISLAGEVSGNSVKFYPNSAIDFHPSKFQEVNGTRKYDERMTHIVGGLAYNSDVTNNKISFDNSKIIVHGPSLTYSTTAATHIVGGICVGKLAPCNSINNSIDIKHLNLDLRVESKSTPLAYNAIVNEIFWGGRTSRGNAIGNQINIEDLQTTFSLNESVNVSGLIEFYGGYAANGEANGNSITANLKQSLGTHDNFLGKNEFIFYGGYATKGASENSITIRNNLTQENVPDNYQDNIHIIGASTVQGMANNNIVSLYDINTALPAFIYAVAPRIAQNEIYLADSADGNTIILQDVKSSKALHSGIFAKNLTNNAVSYNLVQSLGTPSSTIIASKVSIKANEIANNNLINLKDYSSASRENIYVIRGDDEVMNNKMYLENITLGTASDKREGVIVISAGLGDKSHDNLLAIKNLNIDEYHQNSEIYIAPSSFLDQNSTSSSNDNTLYISGVFNIFEGTIVNAISGNYNQKIVEQDGKEEYISAITPSSSKFTRGNHFIVNSNVFANTINNFEHYSFIVSADVNLKKAFINAKQTAINLSSQGALNLYTQDNFALKKGTKIKIMESKAGFADIEGRILDIQTLKSLLSTMSKNTANFSTRINPYLSDKKLTPISYSLETNQNGTIIYMKVL